MAAGRRDVWRTVVTAAVNGSVSSQVNWPWVVNVTRVFLGALVVHDRSSLRELEWGAIFREPSPDEEDSLFLGGGWFTENDSSLLS